MEAAIERAIARLGYATLKPEQEKVVKAFLNGRDVFVSLPTGYGKSLCYGILPFAFDALRESAERPCRSRIRSIVLCVSPLQATMMDQVAKFRERGVEAAFVGEAQSDEDVSRGVRNGDYQLVYISPENLLRNVYFRDMLRIPIYQENLVAFIVDEAHCVKKWYAIVAQSIIMHAYKAISVHGTLIAMALHIYSHFLFSL